MTGDWFCVKYKSHHVTDALNAKYDGKVLIFFLISRVSYRVYLAQRNMERTEGYATALMSRRCDVTSPKFSPDSASNQCFSFSIIFHCSL